MNVRPSSMPKAVGAAALPASRRLDVTVSDGGVQARPAAPPPAAPKPAAAPAPAPTSTPEAAATLTAPEQQALTERFATLPRQGVTSAGYDVRGRASTPPRASLQGGLLDITG